MLKLITYNHFWDVEMCTERNIYLEGNGTPWIT